MSESPKADDLVDDLESCSLDGTAIAGLRPWAVKEIRSLRAQLAEAEANAKQGWLIAGNEHSARIVAESALARARKALDSIQQQTLYAATYPVEGDDETLKANDRIIRGVNLIARVALQPDEEKT